MNTKPTSLEELLSLHNDDFVEAAYEAVLGRDPDPQGRAYYLARLRMGYSKLSVLSQLRESEEQRHGPGLPGLSRALSRYRMGRLALIGWMLRKLLRVEGESVAERLQRAIISELADLRAEISSRPMVATPTGAQAQASGRAAPTAPVPQRRRNAVAEQLSPRAREIFDRLVSG